MTKTKKWTKAWLPKWPTQPSQYRLKKFYQLYYLLFEDNVSFNTEIQILDACKEGHIIVWSSVLGFNR